MLQLLAAILVEIAAISSDDNGATLHRHTGCLQGIKSGLNEVLQVVLAHEDLQNASKWHSPEPSQQQITTYTHHYPSNFRKAGFALQSTHLSSHSYHNLPFRSFKCPRVPLSCPALVFFLRPEVPGFCPSMGEVLSLVTAREPDKAFSAAFLAEVHRAAWNLFSKITQTLSFLWGN